MWKEALHAVAGPLAHALIVSSVRRDEDLAVPVGPPISHGSGPDPDRVLVIGSPIVRGLGVATFDLALSGHLARRLAAQTGRGADVEVHGYDPFDMRRAVRVLREENLGRYDVVLVMVGIVEIISLKPLRAFLDDLDELLGTIAEVAPHSPPVLIAGVAAFMHDMSVPGFAVNWMQSRIERQNRATRQACERSGAATYVDFAPARAGIRTGHDPSGVYESWATALVPGLDGALAVDRPRKQAPVSEAQRQRALDDLHLDRRRDAGVERIVEMARDLLGVDAASLNLIDRDVQWSKAAVGIADADLPRELAICNTTIQQPGVYVIEDLDADPAWEGSPWREGDEHVRFYAGYPLEAPGGERVGALCVMNHEPRQFTPAETATLRDLALRAQALLWQQRPPG